MTIQNWFRAISLGGALFPAQAASVRQDKSCNVLHETERLYLTSYKDSL